MRNADGRVLSRVGDGEIAKVKRLTNETLESDHRRTRGPLDRHPNDANVGAGRPSRPAALTIDVNSAPSVRVARKSEGEAEGAPLRATLLRRALALTLGAASVLHVIVSALGPAGDTEWVGVLLGLGAVALALRVARSGSARELSVLALLGVAQLAAFVIVVGDAPTPFLYRPLLVLTASVYLAPPILLAGMLLASPRARSIILLALWTVGGALVVEAVASRRLSVQGRTPGIPPDRATNPDYVIRYRGPREQHPEIGPIPIANSVSEMVYPDNPRGYFRSRDPSWRLEVQPSSGARFDHTSEGLTVLIDRADDPTPWHIQLRHSGLQVIEGTEYTLSFRIRATRERGYAFGVAMAHPPWESLGLYRNGTVGTEWTPVQRTFTANQSDDSVQVTFNLGGDTADVHVSDLSLAQSGGGPRVESRLSDEHYVTYEWNSRGCRAAEYAIPPPPEAYRVVVLGDDYTQGVGVHAEDVFTSVLERLLRERASQTGDPRVFEVVGCGVRGFSTREERLYYEERARAYQPDLVLVVTVQGDDRSPMDDARPEREPAKWEYLFNAGHALQEMRNPAPPRSYSSAMAELAALHALVRDDGAELAVVVFRNGVGGWDRLGVSVDSTARVLGVPILDLHDALLADPPTPSSDPLPRPTDPLPRPELRVHALDGRPNEIAHQIAAEMIFEWLVREPFPGEVRPRPTLHRTW